MKDEVKEIVSEVFGVDEDDVTPETSPESIDTWDSMNHLKLVTAVEEEFGINFSMEEVESIVNVQTLLDVLQSHVK